MRVIGGERRAHLEVGDDRQVDKETEDPRADEVPDTHGHEEIDSPLLAPGQIVTAFEAFCLSQLDEIPCVQRQKRERYNFQSGEARCQTHVERSLPCEVPMVACADDHSAEIDRK